MSDDIVAELDRLLSPPWNLTETLTKALTGARDRLADQDAEIVALRKSYQEMNAHSIASHARAEALEQAAQCVERLLMAGHAEFAAKCIRALKDKP